MLEKTEYCYDLKTKLLGKNIILTSLVLSLEHLLLISAERSKISTFHGLLLSRPSLLFKQMGISLYFWFTMKCLLN